jgi:transcriptional regulator with XRE-family HTH domain
MKGTIPAMRIDGAKLKRTRLEKFMDIGEVAEASGLHRDYISRLERGDWSGESRPSTVRKLAQGLGVDPHELLEGE